MFIKRKDWERLNAKVKKLEEKTNELAKNSETNSFYFGVGLTFPAYVRQTERAIKELIEVQKKDRSHKDK